jgi:RepB DNA-primase from phage plasmid
MGQETPEMPTDTKQALAMLDAFGSVGVRQFQITALDIEQNKVGYEVRSLDELKRHMSGRLEAATRSKRNIVVRPARQAGVLFVQLDDLSTAEAASIGQHGFFSLETSPDNHQVWVAVSDGPKDGTEAAKEFRRRMKKGTAADKSATNAVRLAGSLNIKPKYAPDFPVVKLSQAQPGKTVTVAELDAAGLLAAPEPITAPPRVFPKGRADYPSRPNAPRHWPDYGRALSGAPVNREGGGPDRSLADFMFCKWAAERGWLADEIAVKLTEVSDKAQEREKAGDQGYAKVTAQNAVVVVEKERGRRQGREAHSRLEP